MIARSVLSRAASRDSGQILVLASVSMVALLGIAALALDASHMFAKRNQLHAAADAAAKSAAYELIRNPGVSLTGLENFADQQVQAHGFSPTRLGGTTTVTVNNPPATGPFAGNARYVEATLSEPTSTFFGRILGWTSMTPGASAVAGAGSPSNCVITNEDLNIGNSTLTLNGCGAGVGEDISGTNPNATINGTPTPTVGVNGSCTGTCGSFGSLVTGAPKPTDPLAGLALPTDPGSCGPGTAASLPPGCYTRIDETVTTLSGGGTGIYYITGPIDSTSLTGSGVMLFLAGGGQLGAKKASTITLSAPTSGPYAGIAIFQDPANTNDVDFKNQVTLDISGAIYMPGADVDFKNGLTIVARSCTLIMTKSLTIKNGNGTLNSSGCGGAFAGASYLSASIAQ